MNGNAQGCRLAIDIGGTNLRASISTENGNAPRQVIKERPHGKSWARLAELVKQAVRNADKHAPLLAVVVAAAGPSTKDTVKLTNWKGQPKLTVQSGSNFHAQEEAPDKWILTFPAKRAEIVNDLVAAVHGLVPVLEGEQLSVKCSPPVSAPKPGERKMGSRSDRRLVLIMPGTGLGTAALVWTKMKQRKPVITAIPSEMQHSEIPPLDEAHARLIERWKAETGAHRLRWEDFVSGKGLETIHRLLGGDEGLDAEKIGKRAKKNESKSVQSLTLYYRCVARYAQLAALAYQPTAGVFLGGGTTRENESFICERCGNLMWWFLENPSRLHHEDLMKIPVHLVLEDINLHGALWLAERLS